MLRTSIRGCLNVFIWSTQIRCCTQYPMIVQIRLLYFQGLSILVQSDRHPDYLDERIEQFLLSMEKEMEIMADNDFEKHKTALIDKYD